MEPLSDDIWPYALRYANNVHNATPSMKTGRSPLEAFSVTTIRPQVLNFHPPFCPVYVLQSSMQGGGKLPNKWVRRSRLALYLGPPSCHAWSVSLVLSLSTGYMSPQYHLKFDDFFETVQELSALPPSNWQHLAHFDDMSKAKTPTSIFCQGARNALRGSVTDPVPSNTENNNNPRVRFSKMNDSLLLGDSEGELPAVIPLDEEILPEPPDPDRHLHPNATR